MPKIKILEVNNIDMVGNRFNGYDMIKDLSDDKLEIKQAVIIKQSNNPNVIKIIKNDNQRMCYEKFEGIEDELSIKNVFSITTPSLMLSKEYQEADIIHFHMFHNTRLSLYSLKKIASEKKVILSLHDPWFLTGRCVHFYDCKKWKNGCEKCPNLSNLFSFKEDNCNSMWNLKKLVFEDLDIDLVVATNWMMDLVKASPITKNQRHIHLIPFGIDYKKFNKVSNKEARKHFNIPKDNIVLFLRAQNEFKGTQYVLDALKRLETDIKITVLTCDTKHLLDEVKDKYSIIDLGKIKDKEMINAMNACDIFLMPSIGESFGMMAVEAMACSKPVIVFNNSALPSVTKAPNCGYLVNDKDSIGLMEAIKYLVEHPQEREKRGKLGYEVVIKEYTSEAYNNHLKSMYIQVYTRNRKILNHRIMDFDNYNVEQFKCYLNELTVRIFGTTSEMGKKLMYDTKNIKYNYKYKIKFDDLNLQELLYNYTNNLAKYLQDPKNIIDNCKKIKIEKACYLLKNNPKTLLKMIMKRFRKNTLKNNN